METKKGHTSEVTIAPNDAKCSEHVRLYIAMPQQLARNFAHAFTANPKRKGHPLYCTETFPVWCSAAKVMTLQEGSFRYTRR